MSFVTTNVWTLINAILSELQVESEHNTQIYLKLFHTDLSHLPYELKNKVTLSRNFVLEKNMSFVTIPGQT